MIGPIVAYTWLASIAGCLVAAIWTQDLRWLGTGLILIMIFALPIILSKSGEKK